MCFDLAVILPVVPWVLVSHFCYCEIILNLHWYEKPLFNTSTLPFQADHNWPEHWRSKQERRGRQAEKCWRERERTRECVQNSLLTQILLPSHSLVSSSHRNFTSFHRRSTENKFLIENESFTFASCWRIAQLKITWHGIDEKMAKNITEWAQNFYEKEDNLSLFKMLTALNPWVFVHVFLYQFSCLSGGFCSIFFPSSWVNYGQNDNLTISKNKTVSLKEPPVI